MRLIPWGYLTQPNLLQNYTFFSLKNKPWMRGLYATMVFINKSLIIKIKYFLT